MKSRKSYSKEFKKSSIRLMVGDGISASQVSQRLGVGRGLDAQALVAENELLHQQLQRPEKINDDAKKTLGYFAEQQS